MKLKFLIDAQLPIHLKHWLVHKGYDTLHTRELPDCNLTEDNIVMGIADKESRVVISKDSDFYKSYLIQQIPKKLLMLTTGNIVNDTLIGLFQRNFEEICHLLETHTLIEMDNDRLIVHE